MISLSDIMNLKELDSMIKLKYVASKHHPTLPYRILNYTQKASGDYVWNNTTETCRGLIVDDDDNIVARPFRKFFNYSEIVASGKECLIPTDEKFTIFDKLDGCLGILFYTPSGKLDVATRGSLTSPQSEWAADYIRKNLSDKQMVDLRDMVCDYSDGRYRQKITLCFEIIYKGEKHIVNYGDKESVTLLAVLDNDTGSDLPLHPYDNFFETPETFDCDWKDVKTVFPRQNAEGFVIKFENGFRMKIKYDEFLNMQKIIKGLTPGKIFDAVSQRNLSSIVPYLSELDEETRLYVKSQIKELLNIYLDVEFDALLRYKDFDSDKEAAEYFKKQEMPSVLFCARKGQDYSKIIWKAVKNKIKERQTFEEETDF